MDRYGRLAAANNAEWCDVVCRTHGLDPTVDGDAWTSRVRTIAVEVHEPYTVADCERDLRELGFETRVDPRHWACVEGLRP